jgi:alkylated DNA repair dioxygenase AlkB
MGKTYTPYRYIAQYGESKEGYNYSGIKRKAHTDWPECIVNLTKIMDDLVTEYHPDHPGFNFVHCNHYPDGDSYIGYHADKEKEHVEETCIGSLSFGATRDFMIKKNKDKSVYKVPLNDGDGFIMETGFQHIYKHSVPKRKTVTEGRINLTFRVFEL